MRTPRPAAAVTFRRRFLASALCGVMTQLPTLAVAGDAPSAAALTAIVFPGWTPAKAKEAWTVHLPSSGRGSDDSGPQHVKIEPQFVIPTGDHSATLIVDMVPILPAHVSAMAISAYQFRHDRAGWHLAGRQDGVAFEGFDGAAGVQVVALSARTLGLAVQSGSCWTSNCSEWLSLYELRNGRVMPKPLVNVEIAGENVSNELDCARRLRPLVPGDPKFDEPKKDEQGYPHDCYAIRASWGFIPSDAKPGTFWVQYNGAISPKAAATEPPRVVDQGRTFAYRNGKYEPSRDDENPIPGG